MTTIVLPKEKKKTIISEKIKKTLEENWDLEGQVVVHCVYLPQGYGQRIRIWSNTFLIDSVTGKRSQLVYAEGIALYPKWTELCRGQEVVFTLIFSRLPKECQIFHLKEIIPEQGGFEIENIERNKTDVYWVRI